MAQAPPPPEEASGPSEADIRRGRRLATIVFLAAISSWVLGASLQIVKQAMTPDVVASPYGSCREGLQHLHQAVERARTDAEGDLDPDSALERFRVGLDPEWSYLTGVRQSCTTPGEIRSLDALERLRYAEEHAVRREAASLAALRRQVASELAHP